MPQQQTFTDVQPITQTFSDVQPIANALSKTTAISAQPKPFSREWFRQGLWRTAASVADYAPAAGATAGGMIGSSTGPVSAVAGAGVGGMGGTAAQQIIRRILGFPDVPNTSTEAAKDIAKGGIIQGAIQGVTELIPPLSGPLERAANSQYERALAPTTKANKVIVKKIAPELIQRGEYGSLASLQERAEKMASDLRPKLDASYGQVPASATTGSGAKIVQDLENLKGKYVVGGKVANPQAVKAIEGVQDIVKQYGADIDPNSLRKLKSIFDDPVASGGGYAGADLSTRYTLKAQKVAANSIRDVMSQASPEIADLNKEITFWLNVQRVTSQSGLRRVGQEGGLTRVLGPLAAGTAASTVGVQFGAHAGIESGVGTALTVIAYQAVRSPLWRTASAVLKDRFADALARGSVGDSLALLARLGVAATGSKQLPSPSSPTGTEQQPSQ